MWKVLTYIMVKYRSQVLAVSVVDSNLIVPIIRFNLSVEVVEGSCVICHSKERSPNII